MSREDSRLVDLVRRMLFGEKIDWEKEGIAESQVLEGLKRLQRVVGQPGASESAATAPPPPPKLPPSPVKRHREDRFIGDFRLVRTLGEGGMGVVYEAEQQHPRRPVALKVIRGGSHVGSDTLKLFQREAQTLARLRHAGIAALYETGITDDGLHFFAMELVRGPTLTAWIRQRPAGPITPDELRLRLSVFKKVCDAVAYAHQRGVIHRDLKPGNVLIPKETAGASFQDPVPDVKVLDFGLARVTDSDVQATTYVTEMGKVQGTLPYMSPEQVRGNPDEIDLRTDVYSLGVLLYEMVTGRLPYDVSKAQLPEAVRIICEDAPKSISATFTGTRHLHADVITIAGKCLEKEPARRYQSAAALGEDVARHLAEQPILARPPSATYQLRKLVARHKGPFAFAATVFVLVTALAVTSTIQAVRISKERDRANREAEAAKQVSEFLEGLFEVSDPSESRGNTVTAREILDEGAGRIERDLRGQPRTQARLMHTMGNVYAALSLNAPAEVLLKQALARMESATSVLERADVLNSLGAVALARGDADSALRFHREAHAIRSERRDVKPAVVARGLWLIGTAQNQLVDPEARSTIEQALRVLESEASSDPELLALILNELGNILLAEGQYDDAVESFRRTQQIVAANLPQDHASRSYQANGLGWSLLLAGRLDESRPWLESAAQDAERVYGANSPSLANILHSLGELERRQGRLEQAASLLRRALQILECNGSPRDFSRTEVLVSLARTEFQRGSIEEPERLLREVVAIFEGIDGPESPKLHEPLQALAEVLRASDRQAEADRIALRAEAIPVVAGYRPVHVNTSRSALGGKASEEATSGQAGSP